MGMPKNTEKLSHDRKGGGDRKKRHIAYCIPKPKSFVVDVNATCFITNSLSTRLSCSTVFHSVVSIYRYLIAIGARDDDVPPVKGRFGENKGNRNVYLQ